MRILVAEYSVLLLVGFCVACNTGTDPSSAKESVLVQNVGINASGQSGHLFLSGPPAVPVDSFWIQTSGGLVRRFA
jgi:hypothetical protein